MSTARRHREHIRDALAKHVAEVDARTVENVKGRLDRLITSTQAIIDKAVEDDRLTLTAIREMRGNLELLAKLTGELKPPSGVTLNIIDVLPTVAGVLRKHPQVMAEVVKALEG